MGGGAATARGFAQTGEQVRLRHVCLHVRMYADYLLQNLPEQFSQEDMPMLRPDNVSVSNKLIYIIIDIM